MGKYRKAQQEMEETEDRAKMAKGHLLCNWKNCNEERQRCSVVEGSFPISRMSSSPNIFPANMIINFSYYQTYLICEHVLKVFLYLLIDDIIVLNSTVELVNYIKIHLTIIL